ncbi:hypothetical protein [Phyllobacterium leguminum]|uniref:DUF1640 domain-containing protein n=1 Tax=Phyllobacterium leguminum TaxID=314237 RepID=A0A318T6C7_9HYPH|nr:hypothetical protein [Phyllobacterium leguminum]PYE90012.1 hypothetical protein C7477_10299 [Phyllobacterium leguminum]
MAITFDTLGYSKRLRDGGIDQKHAEHHAEAVRDFVMPELATKADLRAALETQTLRLTLVNGGMLATAIGILLAALPLFLK